MSAVQAGRYAEAREYLRGQMGHESSAVRDAFANWYMLSDWGDPAAAWSDYRHRILLR
jgi:hypothetical protein